MFNLKTPLTAEVFKKLKDDIAREENRKRAEDTSWIDNVIPITVDYDEIWDKKVAKEKAEAEAEDAKLTPEQKERKKQRQAELEALW